MSGGEKGYVHSKLVRINSATALDSSRSLTDWVADLGTTCQQVNRVSFQSVVFNNNGYNINGSTSSDPNYLGTMEVFDPSDVSTISVPEGYYNISQLLSFLNTNLSNVGDGWSLVFTQDPISYKVRATWLQNASARTRFLFRRNELSQQNVKSIWEVLGFTVPSEDIGNNQTLVAQALPRLTGLRQVYLTSSLLAPSNQIDEKGSFQNVCVNIPITSPFGGVNVWECKVDSLCQITYKTARNIQRVDFQLRDEDGSIINLHGSSVKVELRVWFNKAS